MPPKRSQAGGGQQPASPSVRTPTASPRPSRLTLNSPAASPSQLVPSVQETMYHKRMRAMLQDHKRLRRAWVELVVRKLLPKVRGCIELWGEIKSGIDLITTHEGVEAGAGPTARDALKVSYLNAQTEKLSDMVAAVPLVIEELAGTAEAMKSISARAEALVVEASRVKGLEYAFQEPLWVSWSISRFADGLEEQIAPVEASYCLIRSLVDLLLTFPELEPELAGLGGASGRTAPTSEQVRGAMSLLAVQPFLPNQQGEGSEVWEELMAVEVAGWE